MFDWLHRRMPRSIQARGALILAVPVVALLIGVTAVFVDRHYDSVARQMTTALALDLALVAEQPSLGPALRIAVEPDAAVPPADVIARLDLSGRTAAAVLHDALDNLRAVDLSTRPVRIWVDGADGPLRLDVARQRISASAPHQLLVIALLLAILLLAIAYLFLRNQLRPIQRLAAAATAYGRGETVPLRATGATEVREAIAAFLAMRARVERATQQRTTMLAGISHDLRTPLTRMRLALSMMDGPDAEALGRDVDDMARLVDTFLDYARDEAADEVAPVAIRALMAEEAARHPGAEVEDGPETTVPARAVALRRALANLIANALAHGQRARLSLAEGDGWVRVTVEDDGPGIPPERREEATRPFVRLDPARDPNRGGTGLGLAIVADVARLHGGQLRLGQSEELRGLRVDLILAR